MTHALGIAALVLSVAVAACGDARTRQNFNSFQPTTTGYQIG
jgi:hypothetical protein